MDFTAVIREREKNQRLASFGIGENPARNSYNF